MLNQQWTWYCYPTWGYRRSRLERELLFFARRHADVGRPCQRIAAGGLRFGGNAAETFADIETTPGTDLPILISGNSRSFGRGDVRCLYR